MFEFTTAKSIAIDQWGNSFLPTIGGTLDIFPGL